LSPEEIDDLVALLALWREGKTVTQTPATGETTGADLYAAACAGCHGPAGEGGVGPGLVGNEFLANQSAGELAEFIMAGRPGTAMTGFRGRLNPDEVAAIVELIGSWQP
jgi:cytochrome c oxidase cbb3-type subunit 3